MSPRLLVVDDSRADLELTRLVFEEAGLSSAQLDLVHSGEDALAYLCRHGPYAGRPTPQPALILMDVNMPGLDGVGTLRRIKHDPALQHLPVVMLSTSSDEEDMARSYRAGANGYVVKPSRLDTFFHVAQALRAFWVDTNATLRLHPSRPCQAAP